MKSTKQIANEIGIDKQRVYRYIKRHHIKEAHQKQGVMYYDEAVETQIKQHFSKNTTSSEAHQAVSNDTVGELIAMLKTELEAKTLLIAEQQQTIRILSESINAATKNELAETIIDGQQKLIEETAAEKKRFSFRSFFKKNKRRSR